MNFWAKEGNGRADTWMLLSLSPVGLHEVLSKAEIISEK
jgi:hypothetical protein